MYYLARRFRSRNNADDILSEAILALVECVDRWCEVAEDEDIRRYVAFSVRKRMKDFIDNDAVAKVPSRRVREKLAKGEEFVHPTMATLSRQGSNADPARPRKLSRVASTPIVPADKTFDIQEFFRSRADSRDQMIVEMRINGRSVVEIAEAVGQKRAGSSNGSGTWSRRSLRLAKKQHSDAFSPNRNQSQNCRHSIRRRL